MRNYLFSMLVMLFAGVTLQAEALCNAPNLSNIQIQRISDAEGGFNVYGGGNYDVYVTPHNDPTPPTASTPARAGYKNLAVPFWSNQLSEFFNYDAYIRRNCGGGQVSEWVGPLLVATFETVCINPASFSIVRTSDTSATFTADPGTYDAHIVVAGNPAPANFWTRPNYGLNDFSVPYTRNDLNAGISYDVYVRSQCNVSQVSDWVGPINIPLYSVPCLEPTGVVLTRTSNTTATFDGADPAFMYQGTANREGRPLRDRPMYGMEDMTLPWTQIGLVPSFSYDIWLRTDCGDETYSDWAGPFTLPTYSGGARNMTISPNPSKGQVTIQGMDAVNVQVIGMTGKTELSTPVVNNELNISNLAPGQYIIQAQDADGNVSTTKLIKK